MGPTSWAQPLWLGPTNAPQSLSGLTTNLLKASHTSPTSTIPRYYTEMPRTSQTSEGRFTRGRGEMRPGRPEETRCAAKGEAQWAEGEAARAAARAAEAAAIGIGDSAIEPGSDEEVRLRAFRVSPAGGWLVRWSDGTETDEVQDFKVVDMGALDAAYKQAAQEVAGEADEEGRWIEVKDVIAIRRNPDEDDRLEARWEGAGTAANEWVPTDESGDELVLHAGAETAADMMGRLEEADSGTVIEPGVGALDAVPDETGLHDFVVEGPLTRVWAQSIGKWCVPNSVINLYRLCFASIRRLRAALKDCKILANENTKGLDKTNVLHLLFQVLRADLQNGHLYNLHAKKLAKAKHRGGLGKLAFLLAPCPADEGDNVGYLLVYGNHCVAVSRRKGCYFPSDPRVGKRRALALKPGLFEALQIQEGDVKCVIRLESKAAAHGASKRAHGQVAKRAADVLQPADQQAKRHRVC